MHNTQQGHTVRARQSYRACPAARNILAAMAKLGGGGGALVLVLLVTLVLSLGSNQTTTNGSTGANGTAVSPNVVGSIVEKGQNISRLAREQIRDTPNELRKTTESIKTATASNATNEANTTQAANTTTVTNTTADTTNTNTTTVNSTEPNTTIPIMKTLDGGCVSGSPWPVSGSGILAGDDGCPKLKG